MLSMISSRSLYSGCVRLCASVGCLLLVGAGCTQADPVTAPQGYYADTSYSLSTELWDKGVTYEDQIKMDASPIWETVNMGQILIDIPYSPDWRVEGRAVLPVNHRGEPGSSDVSILFGKYVGAGTYFAREYALEVKYKLMQVGDPILDDLDDGPRADEGPEIRDPEGRLLTAPASPMTIGDVRGMAYLSCGAKGCVTKFFGHREGSRYTIKLRKLYPMGQDDFTHTITSDMQRIIQSVRLVEPEPDQPLIPRTSAGAIQELKRGDKEQIARYAEGTIPHPMNIPTNWALPDGVFGPQMRNGYRLTDDAAFALVERRNSNKPLFDDVGNIWYGTTTFAGVLFTPDQGQTWKKSFEIPAHLGACEDRETFNPVGFFWERGRFYLDIADDCGAGSGEGNTIRYSTIDGSTWKRESCYYFIPEAYYAPWPTNGDGTYAPANGLREVQTPHQLKKQACPKT